MSKKKIEETVNNNAYYRLEREGNAIKLIEFKNGVETILRTDNQAIVLSKLSEMLLKSIRIS